MLQIFSHATIIESLLSKQHCCKISVHLYHFIHYLLISGLAWGRNSRRSLSAVMVRARARAVLLIVFLVAFAGYLLITASTLFSAVGEVTSGVLLPRRKLGNVSLYSPLIFIG